MLELPEPALILLKIRRRDRTLAACSDVQWLKLLLKQKTALFSSTMESKANEFGTKPTLG